MIALLIAENVGKKKKKKKMEIENVGNLKMHQQMLIYK